MIKYYYEIVQGSEEWFAARCGILTASEMKYIITPAKLQYAQNDKERTHLYEILAQRINKYVEPAYVGFDMIRGQDDESRAREIYHEKYDIVKTCGFVTNNKWGFTLGFSPDGLVGDNGIIEVKSRVQKYHIETIIDGVLPEEFKMQIQTALLVSERQWCDFISYCGGMPMMSLRVEPDTKIQQAIVDASCIFHDKIKKYSIQYQDRMSNSDFRFIQTERQPSAGEIRV